MVGCLFRVIETNFYIIILITEIEIFVKIKRHRTINVATIYNLTYNHNPAHLLVQATLRWFLSYFMNISNKTF